MCGDDGDERALTALRKEDLERLEPNYRARAERANAWLSQHAWRALDALECKSRGPGPSDDVVRGSSRAPGCVMEYSAPRYTPPWFVISPRLVVRQRGGAVLADVTGQSWPYRAPDKRCWIINKASLGSAFIDAAAGVVAVELTFVGGRTGCVAPMPSIHVVRVPRGACQ